MVGSRGNPDPEPCELFSPIEGGGVPWGLATVSAVMHSTYVKSERRVSIGQHTAVLHEGVVLLSPNLSKRVPPWSPCRLKITPPASSCSSL